MKASNIINLKMKIYLFILFLIPISLSAQKKSGYTQSNINLNNEFIIIGNLEVLKRDLLIDVHLPEEVSDSAKVIGIGWRIPNFTELGFIYQNRFKIGGFEENGEYMSSNEDKCENCRYRTFKTINFSDGALGNSYAMGPGYKVRLVRQNSAIKSINSVICDTIYFESTLSESGEYLKGPIQNIKCLKIKTYELKTYYENGQLESIYNYLNDNTANGLQKTFYENGQLKEIFSLVNGKSHGISKSYYESGKVERVAYYSNGKNNAPTKSYYENGQLESLMPWGANGKTNGIYMSYYENGQLEATLNMVNDVPHGIGKYYYENGRLERIECYRYGKRHGINKRFSEEGELLDSAKFENDRQVW